MRQFRYKAKKGLNLVKGMLFAETKDAAIERISGMSLTFTELIEEKLDKSHNDASYGIMLEGVKSSRQGRRIAANFPILFRVVEYGGVVPFVLEAAGSLAKIEFQGYEKDLSPGGICFSVSPQRTPSEDFKNVGGRALADILEPGSNLELKMALPDGESLTDCVVMAKIIRVMYPAETQGLAGEPLFQVGAIFLPMTPENRQRLVAFCGTRTGNP